MVTIYIRKTHKDAVVPFTAYDGTSAAFDLTCVEDTLIETGKAEIVPNGLNLTIDQNEPYYMTVHLRSSLGFKKKCVPHIGIIDAGYTGDLSVLVHNLGNEPVTIKKGERYAQILVHQKPKFRFQELSDAEFSELEAKQNRGKGGFGSSNKCQRF